MVALLLMLAPAAHAQEAVAPPGNSGIDQYLEAVPTAAGPAKRRSEKKPVLPARTSKSLSAAGKDGQALEQIVNAHAPQAAARAARERDDDSRGSGGAPASGGGSEPPAGATAATADEPRGTSIARAALDAVADTQDGGMGLALPALLLGSVVFFGLVAARSARR